MAIIKDIPYARISYEVGGVHITAAFGFIPASRTSKVDGADFFRDGIFLFREPLPSLYSLIAAEIKKPLKLPDIRKRVINPNQFSDSEEYLFGSIDTAAESENRANALFQTRAGQFGFRHCVYDEGLASRLYNLSVMSFRFIVDERRSA
ncbi:hypothetical protein J4212_05605 [Candidatus Woesearchaeota archaeon]|nr:hypothetical protein [Candidatus Woesearchaeota archaeon]